MQIMREEKGISRSMVIRFETKRCRIRISRAELKIYSAPYGTPYWWYRYVARVRKGLRKIIMGSPLDPR